MSIERNYKLKACPKKSSRLFIRNDKYWMIYYLKKRTLIANSEHDFDNTYLIAVEKMKVDAKKE
jgi:hypothetical protein